MIKINCSTCGGQTVKPKIGRQCGGFKWEYVTWPTGQSGKSLEECNV